MSPPLGRLVSPAQQQHERFALAAKVDAIPGAERQPRLPEPRLERLVVPQVALFEAKHPRLNACPSLRVEVHQPLAVRIGAVLGEVLADDKAHGAFVSQVI